MKRLALLATSAFAALGLMAADAIAVPDTVSFTGRVSDGNGPIDGTVNLGFQIYTAPTGGTLMWEETYSGVSASNGLVYVNLGSQDPLDTAVFTGADVYLQVIVNGTNQSPRVPINSVPYALSAETAATLGTLTPAQVALSSHNHDASYASAAHNHNSAYAALSHTHDYAPTTHTHNYASTTHTHSMTCTTVQQTFNVAAGATGNWTATCTSGVVTGGGHWAGGAYDTWSIDISRPSGNTGWNVWGKNTQAVAADMVVYARCCAL